MPLWSPNVVWLAMNLLLTGWLLARTAKYLQDEGRGRTLVRFTQCVTLPREVPTYAMGLFLQNAKAGPACPGYGASDIPRWSWRAPTTPWCR
jgi:hypothetical protein